MRSPRFSLRQPDLKAVFSASSLQQTWKHKVRVSIRKSPVPDPIEHLDFHVNSYAECLRLERLVCEGSYQPAPARRLLMEKSKGLCRQITIPSRQDNIILQRLSDALYSEIHGKAPSKRAFFEPEDHRFSNNKKENNGAPSYGSFRSWINFQRALLNFTKTRKYVIVTDVANYYDSISYTHLRNILSSQIDVREVVLDTLIYILSSLLWQPDYMPRIETGLPQINIDAPRILAHCFLYELDEYLEKRKCDFVRYMDDIDIGVDSFVEARRILRDIDLILQTRQVRLNSGKTKILTSE
ncbi:RNA-directed DNA polymerase [Methylorubrum podarium]|uniref:RNA-directed DNA polymerase n=1 Tax=Methylorubrum podarium TaxID=200476 RepID=A0ABV1QNA1_9HYPH